MREARRAGRGVGCSAGRTREDASVAEAPPLSCGCGEPPGCADVVPQLVKSSGPVAASGAFRPRAVRRGLRRRPAWEDASRREIDGQVDLSRRLPGLTHPRCGDPSRSSSGCRLGSARQPGWRGIARRTPPLAFADLRSRRWQSPPCNPETNSAPGSLSHTHTLRLSTGVREDSRA